MKKLFSFASVLVLALVLAACGNGGGKDKTITVGASPRHMQKFWKRLNHYLKTKVIT